MEKLLLVGAGGFGRVVLEHASLKYECAFVDDADVTEVNGVPVIGKIADIEKLFDNYKQLVVSIGNNRLREKIYKKAETSGIFKYPKFLFYRLLGAQRKKMNKNFS